MSDCTPSPDQDTENINHDEFEEAVRNRSAALLEDAQTKGGRFQKGAGVMGGDVVLVEWHSPKSDGNWHRCGGFILPKGSIETLAALLSSAGYPLYEGKLT